MSGLFVNIRLHFFESLINLISFMMLLGRFNWEGQLNYEFNAKYYTVLENNPVKTAVWGFASCK